MSRIFIAIFCCSIATAIVADRQITFVNRCSQIIWINPSDKNGVADLDGGIKKLNQQDQVIYNIPDDGWQGRFWPKLGCDNSGQSCAVGQSVAPCPEEVCQPPADTKIEFFFPSSSDSNSIWYDISLVDGYSLPVDINPSQANGSCVESSCNISLNDCPSDETDVGDLRVTRNDSVVQCLSPCKKWNFSSPYGLGKNEQQDPGAQYCCPTPPVSSEQCNNGKVVNTKFVNIVRLQCPSAYSFAYDDKAGLHNCPNPTSFVVNVC